MGRRRARAAIEIGFIVFLFYANLLMGKYERSGGARTGGLLAALDDIFTWPSFVIAVLAALVGYVVVELLRKRLS